jgi:peptidoglycan/xylan/chitin deacetylase (PgdA/CDA1 family)
MNWRRWGIGVLAVLAGVIGLWQLSKARTVQIFGELHARVETQQKVVALTATFFMVGQNIEAHRELAARVLAEGHQLGNHSYSHTRLILRSPSFIQEEISRTDSLLRELGVQGEILFRAPFGKKLFVLPWLLARAHRKHITFDVVPDDHATQDAALITSRILEATRPGSIILLHDGWAAKPGTLEAAGRVIEHLKAQGYRFVTVSELLAQGQGAPTQDPPGPTPSGSGRPADMSSATGR